MAIYDVTAQAPTKIKTGDILNCPYAGVAVSLTLPKGVYKLECWGAQGGTYGSYKGGAGGYSVGVFTATAVVETILVAGGQPATVSTSATVVPGGYNGGGNGCNRTYDGTSTYGQGGGGGSDIRIGQDSLYARVIVAGGGGGSASANALTKKYGGGTSGGSNISEYGATQTAPGTNGAFGVGGAATPDGKNYKYGSGGGGGGWYGGGACSSYSDSTNYRDYNGGGSGFVWTGVNAPDGYLLGAEHYLTDAQTIAGSSAFLSPDGAEETGHTGNGYVRITCVYSGVDAPTNLRQTKKDRTSIAIAWNAVSDAAGYKVYKNGVLVSTTTETTYSEDGWLPGRYAEFSVLAYNSKGDESDATSLVVWSEYLVPRTLQATLPSDTLYVSGTVDGAATAWTNTSGHTWETVTERSPDDTYYVVLTIINDLGTSTTMAFTMYYGLHLMYDRTLSDVQKVAKLAGVGFANMSEAERAEWLAGLKGAYNEADLNRVESAVAFIADYLNNIQTVLDEHADSFGVAKDPLFDAGIVAVYPVTKSTWSAADVPSVEDLARYLSNVDMVTDVLPIAKSLPADMNRLTYVSANAIEKALMDVYDAGVTLENNLKDRISRTAAAWYYSDDIYSGEVK